MRPDVAVAVVVLILGPGRNLNSPKISFLSLGSLLSLASLDGSLSLDFLNPSLGSLSSNPLSLGSLSLGSLNSLSCGLCSCADDRCIVDDPNLAAPGIDRTLAWVVVVVGNRVADDNNDCENDFALVLLSSNKRT
jgi:hypothetical protein